MKPKTANEIFVLKLIGFTIAVPLIGLILMWYNYVLIQWHVSWWQWFVLAAVSTLISDKLKAWPLSVIGAASLIGQVLAWMALVRLPLIH